MPKFIDLSGQKFGQLLVVKTVGKNKQGSYSWLCKCSCGEKTIVSSDNLRRCHTQSCGCLHKETLTKHGHNSRNKVSPTYRSWKSVIQRCNNPNYRYYHHYGGRGIQVCSRWKNFAHFLTDMGERPKGHQIDRIDNNGNYCKSNCRWVTPQTNSRNRRNNHLITLDGQTKCLTFWSEKTGINRSTIRNRLNRGWSVEKSLTTPTQKQRRKLSQDIA